MLPSRWASSGHKRTKLHWIHRGTAFQTSAKGADVDHDVYFARESLQDGLRRAVQTEQTVNHNEAVCVQSVDVCWTSLSPLTFFFVFFLSFAVLVVPFASFRLFGLSFHIFHVQTVPFGVNAHLEDCKYCWNCCAICAATGPTWQTPGSHGYTGYRTGKDARCCKDWKGERNATD